MPPRDALGGRIDNLEIQVAHQERVIEDLNATIMAQWRQIDHLVRQVAQFDSRLREVGTTPGAGQEPPPPHY